VCRTPANPPRCWMPPMRILLVERCHAGREREAEPGMLATGELIFDPSGRVRFFSPCRTLRGTLHLEGLQSRAHNFFPPN
jgi:hypothetical protein